MKIKGKLIEEFSLNLTKEKAPSSLILKKYGEFKYDVYIDKNADIYVDLYYNGSQTAYKLERDESLYDSKIILIYSEIGRYLPHYGLIASSDKISYECISLHGLCQIRIHRIMAHVYLDKRIDMLKAHRLNKGSSVIDHIDGNTMNNKLSNLQLLTLSENSKKAKLDYIYYIYDNDKLIDTVDSINDIRMKYTTHTSDKEAQSWNGLISTYITKGLRLNRKYYIVRKENPNKRY